MTAPRAEWARREVVIGIDPDTKASGFALAIGGDLFDVRTVPTNAHAICRYVRDNLDGYMHREGDRYVSSALAIIELPAARGREHVRRANLIDLALVVGQWRQALAQFGVDVYLVEASPGWKGSVDKATTERRLLREFEGGPPILTCEERALVPAVKRGRVTKEQRGEMIDAVGICMWALGRYR